MHRLICINYNQTNAFDNTMVPEDSNRVMVSD